MNYPRLLVLFLCLNVTACAGLMQSASLNEAYKYYERGDYDRTLELIAQAEAAREPAHGREAELAYLKARAHEQLGEADTARTLYSYLAEQHSESQYGYLASKKLSDKR